MCKQHTIIVAVVTSEPKNVQGGGSPVFIVQDDKELQTVAMSLEKIMDASAQEINTKTIILVAR